MSALVRSITGRIFLILIGGVMAAALLTFGLALGERQQMIAGFREYHAVERVAQFILSLDNVPPDLPLEANRSELAARLEQRLGEGHRVSSAVPRPSDCPPPPMRGKNSGRRL